MELWLRPTCSTSETSVLLASTFWNIWIWANRQHVSRSPSSPLALDKRLFQLLIIETAWQARATLTCRTCERIISSIWRSIQSSRSARIVVLAPHITATVIPVKQSLTTVSKRKTRCRTKSEIRTYTWTLAKRLDNHDEASTRSIICLLIYLVEFLKIDSFT